MFVLFVIINHFEIEPSMIVILFRHFYMYQIHTFSKVLKAASKLVITDVRNTTFPKVQPAKYIRKAF